MPHPTPSTLLHLPHPCSLRRAAAVLLAALASGGSGGCGGLFDDDGADMLAPPERLRQIEALTIESHSTTPPMSVDDATREVLREAIAPKPPVAELALTIAEVRAATLENNLDLRVEMLDPTVAATAVREEEAKFESTFTAAARATRIDSPTDVATEGSQTDINSYDLGVRIPLRTGGTANVSLPFEDTETNNPFSTLNPSYESDLRFSISQPLLRNAGFGVNTHSIRVARYEEQTAEARTKLETIRVLASADRAYWRLYAARRELEVRQQQYELAMAQLDRAERKVRAGDVAEVEILRAQSGVASRLEAIIIAEANLRRRERDLKRLMNRPDLPMESPTAIIPATEPQPSGLQLDPLALAEFALANRMELLELELQLAIDSSTIDFEKNRALPLFILDYSYTINGLGRTYGDAFDQLPDHSFEDWSLGLQAEIPIGNEAAKARVHRSVLQRVQRLATRSQRSAAIRQEVYDALDQLQQNWQRILAARQETILSGRLYEAEQRQFDQQLRTSTDVLEAAADLADAQSREILALADYHIAQIDIAFATGTLLGHDRVSWEPAEIASD